ncbi:MAG: hypothetical protein KIT09_35015 [Bryobacteraceae bacterium]|nr:hypothetical protein [Bryobacteraceae bacterium]
MTEIEAAFRRHAEAHAQRVLSHLDRDPDSPAYGCFDRDHWHYKIRDFPSSILQQGVFLLEALRKGRLSAGVDTRRAGEWALAAINALARQVRRRGAVDEYYPREQSYPAAAFALWAAARVLTDWKAEGAGLYGRVDWAGLARLRDHLAGRVETEASNQYAAGVAALALAERVPELDRSDGPTGAHAGRLFALQHAEGWFPEYGGPDFGYLTVTLDALADYYEATRDGRAAEASLRAIEFLASLVGPDGRLPWTLNSRNTDYVTPYGLVRAAADNPLASWLVKELFGTLGRPAHSLWAIDDRYHLHYIYASVVRSLPYLKQMAAPKGPSHPAELWLPGCGFWVVRRGASGEALYAGARKGGVVRVQSPGGATRLDNGWRVRAGATVFTTNWWSDHWQIVKGEGSLRIEGAMQSCRFHRSTPLRHAVLRALALAIGRRLTPLLKRVMIFRRGRSVGPWRRREITTDESGFKIRDEFAAAPGRTAVPAPRQNLRHVASAGGFHPEEWLEPLHGTEPLDLASGGVRELRRSWQPLETEKAAGEGGVS